VYNRSKLKRIDKSLLINSPLCFSMTTSNTIIIKSARYSKTIRPSLTSRPEILTLIS
jgi:hypothetical protein